MSDPERSDLQPKSEVEFSFCWTGYFLRLNGTMTEGTECPYLSSDRTWSTGSSHHVAERIYISRQTVTWKLLNLQEAEALHLKLRSLTSKGYREGDETKKYTQRTTLGRKKKKKKKRKRNRGLHSAKLYKFTAMAGHSPFLHSLGEMKGKIVCSLWFRLGQNEV